MKKITFLALAAAAALGFSSCGNSTPKADLNDDLDTLSYAIGMAQSNGLSQYLVERMGVDSTCVEEFRPDADTHNRAQGSGDDLV